MSTPNDFGDFLTEVGLHDDGSGGDIADVLDSTDAIESLDRSGTLWTLATSGSQLRRAVAASSAWTGRLAGAERPRAVLVATDSYLAGCGPLLAELGSDQAPVIALSRARLPRWAGPADVLLAASLDGRHPQVAALVAEADRRGLVVVLVCPDDSPAAAVAGRAVRAPVDDVTPRRAAAWAAVTSLLVAAASLGVVPIAAGEWSLVAEALDDLAARCAPRRAGFENEAKQLAIDLDEADAIILGCGGLTSLAARQTAATLIEVAAAAALAIGLPDELSRALSLLRGAPAEIDFFRDRVDDAGRTRRLVAFNPAMTPLPDRGGNRALMSGAGPDWRDTAPDLIESASSRAAARVRDAALRAGVRYSVVEPQVACALAGYAEQVLFGEFVAAYLAIGHRLDPDFDPGPA